MHELDPSIQQNMFLLKDAVEEQTQPIPTNLIKQRSDLWKSVRSLAYVTGSTLHSALGLRGLKEQKTHFDVNVLGKEPSVVSETTQKYLDHGTQNEKLAVATLSGKFLPIFYPDLNYVEKGTKKVQVGKDQEKAQSEKDSHSKNRGGKKQQLTIRYLYHETYRKPNEQLFSQ